MNDDAQPLRFEYAAAWQESAPRLNRSVDEPIISILIYDRRTKEGSVARKKPVAFVGDSKDRLRDFPLDAKREAGFQIDKVQAGGQPDDFRPMPSVGPGVMEIRIREDNGAFRVFYVANRGDAVFVLHCFQKKTQKTARKDIDLGKQRYKELP